MYEKGVSICITAYKADKFIKECLDSVMNQTWLKKFVKVNKKVSVIRTKKRKDLHRVNYNYYILS